MKNKPMEEKDIPKHPDKHIDQDFEGYPHAPSKKEIIKPKSEEDKHSANLNVKDGEKRMEEQDGEIDNGSGNAFEGTERVQDDE